LQETLTAKEKQLAELLDKVDISKKKEAELRDIILDKVGDQMSRIKKSYKHFVSYGKMFNNWRPA
jgi:hypothetical protein